MGAHVLIFGQYTMPVHLSNLLTGSGGLGTPYPGLTDRSRWDMLGDFTRIAPGDHLYFYVQGDTDPDVKVETLKSIYEACRGANHPIASNRKRTYIDAIRQVANAAPDPKVALYSALDACRITVGDRFRFVNYLLGECASIPAGYYGMFEATSRPYVTEYTDHEPHFDVFGYPGSTYSGNRLTENLWIRCEFVPKIIFPNPVPEPQLLDDKSDNVISWALVYRKLLAARSCTPLPPPEERKLVRLLFELNDTYELAGPGSVARNTLSAGGVHQTTLSGGRVFDMQCNTRNRINHGTDIAQYLATDLSQVANGGALALEGKLEAHLCFEVTHTNSANTPLGQILNADQEQVDWLGNQVVCSASNKRADIVCFHSRKDDPFSQLSSITVFELKVGNIDGKEFFQAETYAQWLAQTYMNGNLHRVKRVILGYKDPQGPLSQGLTDLITKLSAQDAKIPCAIGTYSVINGALSLDVHYHQPVSNKALTSQVWDTVL